MADTLQRQVRALHIQAERSGIVSDILHGRANLAGYMRLLRNLLPCYEAMEAALARHAGTPLLGEIACPALYRSAAIRADLRRHAASGHAGMPLLPIAQAYAERIAVCGDGDGHLLLAHAYTRYLGDLNGGAVIMRLLQPLTGQAGLQFHRFAGIADPAAFAPEYRAAFDRAGAYLADWTPVLREAATAFQFNIDISTAVADPLIATPER